MKENVWASPLQMSMFLKGKMGDSEKPVDVRRRIERFKEYEPRSFGQYFRKYKDLYQGIFNDNISILSTNVYFVDDAGGAVSAVAAIQQKMEMKTRAASAKGSTSGTGPLENRKR